MIRMGLSYRDYRVYMTFGQNRNSEDERTLATSRLDLGEFTMVINKVVSVKSKDYK